MRKGLEQPGMGLPFATTSGCRRQVPPGCVSLGPCPVEGTDEDVGPQASNLLPLLTNRRSWRENLEVTQDAPQPHMAVGVFVPRVPCVAVAVRSEYARTRIGRGRGQRHNGP